MLMRAPLRLLSGQAISITNVISICMHACMHACMCVQQYLNVHLVVWCVVSVRAIFASLYICILPFGKSTSQHTVFSCPWIHICTFVSLCLVSTPTKPQV
ncbi:hypothetical protein SORBI_3008G181050 [Sorghum bicolor]|uniref:Uncharacterized protein n=1 Tax=Sorghum bicolor TaxID=4558 RepID=A0A1Z5R8C0_SORBI|nr:hypothetical protein SORBI_3008G181050 [Sorghum bicolor]